MNAAPVSGYSQGSIIAPIIMGIVGNLRTMQLEELLQWLSQSRKTGTLEIKTDKVEKKIFFRDGQIVATASTRPEEHLGHFLVSHGLISESALAKAIELQEATGMLMGKILVTKEILKEPDLHQMLKLKSEESIYDIFAWPEGDFRFLDDVLPQASSMVPMVLDITAILMEGVQRVDEFRRIRQLVPSQDAIPVQIYEWEIKDEDPGTRQILDLVDDERTVEEIRLQTHSSEFHVCKVLYEQWTKGRLKVVKPRWREQSGTFHAMSGPLSGTTLLEAGQKYLADQDYELALRHLRAARSLEPENPDVQDALSQGEKAIREAIEASGVKLTSVPSLAISFDQLTSAKVSPQEGFMLTRLNGSYDIQSILKITPMPQLDALLVFWKLNKGGYIKLAAGKGKG
jgi:tetratricopeptide (TPR) repeat protein